MRLARVVADERASLSATRIRSDASVCARRVAGRFGVEPAAAWLCSGAGTAGAFDATTPEDVWVVAVPPASRTAPCETRTCSSPPERTTPFTSAAATATRHAAGNATSTSRRGGTLQRARVAGRSASTRARRLSGARGECSRSSASIFSSFADIVHPLLESPQGTTEPRRAGGPTDPEHARRTRPVEVEQHAECNHLPLCRRELSQRLLQRAGEPVAELLDERDAARICLLAPPPSCLGAEPVDRNAAGDLAQPSPRRGPAGIEAPPAAEGLLERLGGQILGSGAVAGQVDEIAVHGIELLGGDLREARAAAHERRRVERGRDRIHAWRYGAAPAYRHRRHRR